MPGDKAEHRSAREMEKNISKSRVGVRVRRAGCGAAALAAALLQHNTPYNAPGLVEKDKNREK